MWRWTNVQNLDNFLNDVYNYYIGKGIWSILLARVLNLLTTAFVVGFVTFLMSCVNYSLIPKSKKLDEILIPKCTNNMPFILNVLLWLFCVWWFLDVFNLFFDFRKLRHLQDFYQHLLHIPDVEMQTISWPEIVGRIMNLRDANPTTATNMTSKTRKFVGLSDRSKQRMDAHDIANRVMRRENYMIALVNKDVLDLTLPVPFLGNRQVFSRSLEVCQSPRCEDPWRSYWVRHVSRRLPHDRHGA